MRMVIKRKLNYAYKCICKNSDIVSCLYLVISDILMLITFISIEKGISNIDLSFKYFTIFAIIVSANAICANIADHILSKDA